MDTQIFHSGQKHFHAWHIFVKDCNAHNQVIPRSFCFLQTSSNATCEEIRSLGGEAYSYKCDVTDIDSVKKTAEGIRQDMGEVDILVNNAGIMNVKEIMDLTERDIRRTIDINTTSHFWV